MSSRADESTASAAVRVGLYVRISSDPNGTELGVKRQEKELRALCKRRGWVVVDVYCDNDVSASGSAKRPEYDRLFDDVRSGRITAVAAWAFDRLTRSMRELEDIIDLHDQYGANLATVEGEIDLGTEVGRMVARILAAVARAELEKRRSRQLAERRQAAASGAVSGGGRRPFGYQPDKITIDESEAAAIREAAKRVLNGETLRSVCTDFGTRGIVGTYGGKPMGPETWRRVLCTARISGRREHWQGDLGARRPVLAPIVGEGDMQAIISVEDSDALRSILTRRTRSKGAGARKHLLPGFVVCSACERKMQSAHLNVLSYACAYEPGGPKCRKTISAARVEEVVTQKLFAVLDSAEYAAMLHEQRGVDRALVEQLSRDSVELEEIGRERAAGELTKAEWSVMRDVLVERIRAAQMTIDAQMNHDAIALLRSEDGSDIEQRWERLTLSQRRACLSSAIERVIVHPATKHGNVFDVTRVEVIWHA